MKYQFVKQHKQEFPIVVMCQILGVSESGFSAWRKRPTCRRQREDAQITQEIEQVFDSHQGHYGSPRIHRELRDQGRAHFPQTSGSTDAAPAELSAWRKRRRVLTTRRDLSHPVAPNIENAGIYSFSTEQEMGHGYHVYSNSAGVALSCSHSRSLFADGCGVVNVGQL